MHRIKHHQQRIARMKHHSFWNFLFGGRPLFAPQPSEGSSAENLLATTLMALVNTPSLAEKQSIVKQHPELLGAEADSLLTRGQDERATAILEKYRHLLDLCRQIGVDAAFAFVEGQQGQGMPEEAAFGQLLKVIQAHSLAEMEQAIREDPRVVDRRVRDLFSAFIAAKGTFGIPMEHVQVCMQVLESCDRQGIDATFRSLGGAKVHVSKDGSATLLFQACGESVGGGPIQAFNTLASEFNAGREAPDLGARVRALVPRLPSMLRRSCLHIPRTSHPAPSGWE